MTETQEANIRHCTCVPISAIELEKHGHKQGCPLADTVTMHCPFCEEVTTFQVIKPDTFYCPACGETLRKRRDNMTEPLPFYSAGMEKDREPWRCPGCGECIGFIYRHPRRLVIDTDNVLFVVRGDAEIRHHCGAVMHWLLKREHHGMLEELETTQEIVEAGDE